MIHSTRHSASPPPGGPTALAPLLELRVHYAAVGGQGAGVSSALWGQQHIPSRQQMPHSQAPVEQEEVQPQHQLPARMTQSLRIYLEQIVVVDPHWQAAH